MLCYKTAVTLYSIQELVSLLKSIKNDIDLNKTKETPNKTEKTPNGTEKTPNITEKSLNITENTAIKAEANPIKTDESLATSKKKGSRKSEKKKSANFDFCK